MTGVRRRSVIVAGGAAASLLAVGAPASAGTRVPGHAGQRLGAGVARYALEHAF